MPKYPARTYEDINRDKVDFEYLRNKIKVKHLEEKQKFARQFPKINEFLVKRSIDIGKIREHSAKLIGSGILSGSLLLTSPGSVKALPAPHEIIEKFRIRIDDKENAQNKKEILVESLSSILPQRTRPLERNEEKLLEQLFQNIIGIPARATLMGEHLNTTYGRIGYEQHLKRYPGDSLIQHNKETQIAGIAPGLGAWGYFAKSKDTLTPDLIEKEKWYAVVQTLYLPDWNTRQPYLKDWYKFRKVLIVNTKNGNAVVASVADSGPAAWTGKHYGGSPEVMGHLGGAKYRKGEVIIFFVDDPENKIPLGPVEYN